MKFLLLLRPLRPTVLVASTPIKGLLYSLIEMETVEGTRLQIEAIDTPGYNDDASPETRAEEVLRWVENSFDEVYAEEIKTDRNPKFEEHRIHALLYFIEPTGL